MTPAERTAKIAELRAEADRLERGWPDKVERGMVFQQMATKEVYIMSGRNRLVCVTDGGEWSGDQGFSNRENGFTYLGYAHDVITTKTPDAPEPTGADLVGKVCEFSDDGKLWTSAEPTSEVPDPRTCLKYLPGDRQPYANRWAKWKFARLRREDRP